MTRVQWRAWVMFLYQWLCMCDVVWSNLGWGDRTSKRQVKIQQFWCLILRSLLLYSSHTYLSPEIPFCWKNHLMFRIFSWVHCFAVQVDHSSAVGRRLGKMSLNPWMSLNDLAHSCRIHCFLWVTAWNRCQQHFLQRLVKRTYKWHVPQNDLNPESSIFRYN